MTAIEELKEYEAASGRYYNEVEAKLLKAVLELEARVKALEPLTLEECPNCEGRCTSGAV